MPNKNDFTRSSLSINPTVGPMSNYIAKPAERVFVENDPLLSLARSLENLNPRMKALADIREKKLLEEGYAEASAIMEANGDDRELKLKYAQAERENGVNVINNPYTKRFIDRFRAQELSLDKFANITLELEKSGAYNEADPEKFLAITRELSQRFDQQYGEELFRMDKRELAAVYQEADRKMPGALMGKYQEYQAARLKEKRGTAVDNKLSQILFNDDWGDLDYSGIEGNEEFKEHDVFKDNKGEYYIEKVTTDSKREIKYKKYIDRGTQAVINSVRIEGDKDTAKPVGNVIPNIQAVYLEALESGTSAVEFKERFIRQITAAIEAEPEQAGRYKNILCVGLGSLKWENGYVYGGNKEGTPIASVGEIKDILDDLDSATVAASKTKWEKKAQDKARAMENIYTYALQFYSQEDNYNKRPFDFAKEMEIDAEYRDAFLKALTAVDELRRGPVLYNQEKEFAKIHEDILNGETFTSETLFVMVESGNLHVTHADKLIGLQSEWVRTGKAAKMQQHLSDAFSRLDLWVGENKVTPDRAILIKKTMKMDYMDKAEKGLLKKKSYGEIIKEYSDMLAELASPASPSAFTGDTSKIRDLKGYNRQNIGQTVAAKFLRNQELNEYGSYTGKFKELTTSEEYWEKIKNIRAFRENLRAFRHYLKDEGGYDFSDEQLLDILGQTETVLQNGYSRFLKDEEITSLKNELEAIKKTDWYKRFGMGILMGGRSSEYDDNEIGEEIKKREERIKDLKKQ